MGRSRLTDVVGGQEKLPSSESSVGHSKIRSDFALTCFLYARFASFKLLPVPLAPGDPGGLACMDLCIWF